MREVSDRRGVAVRTKSIIYTCGMVFASR